MLLKSGINRIGGKAYLSQWLCSFLPEHTLYCEPFAGGAKLLFAKEPSPIEILNDVDDNLVNLYQCIQNPEKRSKLINFLNETPYSRSIFQSWKYGNEMTQDDIEKAGRYFFLCKASFAGDVERGGFGIPSKGTGRNPAMTYQNSIDAIEHIAKRLRGVTIECLDYKDCISKYDSESSLFFIDAPYFLGNSNKARRYYGLNFGYEEHIKLSSLFHSVKGKVMFCHYEHPEIDRLYGDWNKHTFESFKGSSKAVSGAEKPKTVECLWTNFEPELRSLFDAME